MTEQYPGLSDQDAKVWEQYCNNIRDDSYAPAPKYSLEVVLPSRLDLHGYTIHNAWIAFGEFIEQHHLAGTKTVIVVTGRSGQIAREFKEWCRRNQHIRRYLPIETRSGVGSYRVELATPIDKR